MVFDEVTFGDIARRVLALKEPPLKSKATYRSARLHIGRLIDHFGNLPMKDFSEPKWLEYCALQKKLNPKRRLTHDRIHARMVCLFAIAEGYLLRKPKLAIPDRPRSIGRELSDDELKALLEHAGPRLRFQIEIAYKMGLRKGEMMNLRWSQFDWCSKQILFTHGTEETKTRKGRVVPINSDLLPRFQMKCALGSTHFVFPSKLDPDYPMAHNHTAWRVCKRKAGVKARWHDLRHTCASKLARAGVPMHVTARMLGMSRAVLEKIYAHVNTNDLWLAATAMAERR